ncbi:MAG: protein kinase [Erythrobacter sp.]|nr:protein kinase [Erythrobacter sp.]
MSKVYSNKALPPGTVLREWRLEDVLGVGGFGIVYKARGIYFDELVAIKEYFPSAISERQDDATIVPVDSDAEEVHALGLKKFVEEAKLLWNLSTPSRHPNIVSVRSLFEIHGSAYMVMDFEDGVSLSRLLKEGRRFNEASLSALIRPIAEGLERAHRVGVLHRDIKPPNILVGHDNRPVLIDFGSARFESGDATSTSVTFHTPPYAAIEQYVKTYEQGPWTDIYALGVVLYECVAGEKPAEVLERLHGSASKPLSEGDWPGFSRSFLAAVDAAMAIRPDERPRSISEWLALFDRPDGAAETTQVRDDDEDDKTRIGSFAASSERIVPVAPPPPGFETGARIETAVPDSPSEAEFTLAGMNTRAKKPIAGPLPDAVPENNDGNAKDAAQGADSSSPVTPPSAVSASPKTGNEASGSAAKPKTGSPMIYAGMAAVAIVLAGGTWYVMSSAPASSTSTTPQEAAAAADSLFPTTPSDQPPEAAALGSAIGSLAEEAKRAGLPASASDPLAAAARRITALEAGSGTAAAAQAEIDAVAKPALLAFTKATAADVAAKARRASRQIPWTDPRRTEAARGASAGQRRIAAALQQRRSGVESAMTAIGQAATGSEALVLARNALADARAYAAKLAEAYRAGPAGSDLQPKAGASDAAQTQQAVPKPSAGAPVLEQAVPADSAKGAAPEAAVSAATLREFASVVKKANGVARDVIRLGDRSRPDANAAEDEQEKFRIRQQNAQSAKSYQTYLDTLSRSMKGIRSDAEARQSVAKARQTLGYLNTMLADSKASLK